MVRVDTWHSRWCAALAGAYLSNLWGVEMKYEITKGSEKDFEGAPEWARFKTSSYYFEGFAQGLRWAYIYLRNNTIIEEGVWFGCDEVYSHHRSRIIAERRPITEPVVWLNLDECDGSEYLGPVVGKEMECHAKDGSIFAVVVVAFDGDLPIVKNKLHGNYFGCDPSQLKPIRSPEDVARDADIKQIMETFRVDGELVPDNVAMAMWDAGYRKME